MCIMLKKFKIVAKWEMVECFEVVAESMEKAIEMVEENEDGCSQITNAYSIGNYVDDTFEVIKEDCEESDV